MCISSFSSVLSHYCCPVIFIPSQSLYVTSSQWWGSISGLPGVFVPWTWGTHGSASVLRWLRSTSSYRLGSWACAPSAAVLPSCRPHGEVCSHHTLAPTSRDAAMERSSVCGLGQCQCLHLGLLPCVGLPVCWIKDIKVKPSSSLCVCEQQGYYVRFTEITNILWVNLFGMCCMNGTAVDS